MWLARVWAMLAPLRSVAVLVVVSIASVTVACGQASEPGSDPSGTPGGTEPGEDVPPTGLSEDPVKTADGGAPSAAYPSGPYGYAVGQKLADVSSRGLRFTTTTGTTKPAFEAISLQSVRAANPACKCMLVNIAAVWCSTCTDEQPILKKMVADDPSFCVVETLQEGARESSETTEAEVIAWTQRHAVNFPVLLGNATGKHYIDEHQSAPVNVMVRADTMTIVGVSADTVEIAPLLAACRK